MKSRNIFFILLILIFSSVVCATTMQNFGQTVYSQYLRNGHNLSVLGTQAVGQSFGINNTNTTSAGYTLLNAFNRITATTNETGNYVRMTIYEGNLSGTTNFPNRTMNLSYVDVAMTTLPSSCTAVGNGILFDFPDINLSYNKKYVMVMSYNGTSTAVLRTCNNATDSYANGSLILKSDGLYGDTYDTLPTTRDLDFLINFTELAGTTVSITAFDNYNGTVLTSFNATVSNSSDIYNYTTSNGSITTNFSSGTFNISVYANNYDTGIFLNRVMTSNLNANLSYYQYHVNVTANSTLNSSRIQNISVTYNSLNSSDTQTVNTSDGQAELTLNKNETYTLTINSDNFATHFANETINDNSAYNYLLYPANSVLFTFYDEGNSSLFWQNITLEIFNSINATTYTIQNGTQLIQNFSVGNYTARYTSTNFTERFYYFDITNLTYYEIDLYLLANTASTCTATVYDENADYVEGAKIYVQKYFVSTNSYQTVDMIQTNFEGIGTFSCEINTEFYKFIIEYNSESLLETSPSYIFDTSLVFQINLQDTSDLLFYSISDFAYNLSFTNATKNFNYVWTNTGSTVVEACLKIYDVSPITETLYNSSCVSSASGTILLGVAPTVGKTYKAVATVEFIAGEETYLDTLYQSFNNAITTFGNTGLFFLALAILLAGCIGIWNPVASAVLIGIPPIVFDILQITDLGKTICVAWFALWIIIAYMISDRS